MSVIAKFNDVKKVKIKKEVVSRFGAEVVIYGYECTYCNNVVRQCHLDENTIMFHCYVCGAKLIVDGVIDGDETREANPYLIFRGDRILKQRELRLKKMKWMAHGME